MVINSAIFKMVKVMVHALGVVTLGWGSDDYILKMY